MTSNRSAISVPSATDASPIPDAPGPPGFTSSDPTLSPVAFDRETAICAVAPPGVRVVVRHGHLRAVESVAERRPVRAVPLARTPLQLLRVELLEPRRDRSGRSRRGRRRFGDGLTGVPTASRTACDDKDDGDAPRERGRYPSTLRHRTIVPGVPRRQSFPQVRGQSGGVTYRTRASPSLPRGPVADCRRHHPHPGTRQGPRGQKGTTMSDSKSSASTSEDRLYGSAPSHDVPKRKTRTHHLQAMKAEGERWAMLTAYDYSSARIFEEAGIPVLLVGDRPPTSSTDTRPPSRSRSTNSSPSFAASSAVRRTLSWWRISRSAATRAPRSRPSRPRPGS